MDYLQALQKAGKVKRRVSEIKKKANAKTDSLPRSTQNARLVKKRTTRRNGAHLKPKNLKLENSKSYEASTGYIDANNKPTTSILKNQKT